MRLVERCAAIATFYRIINKGRPSRGVTWLFCLHAFLVVSTAMPLKRGSKLRHLSTRVNPSEPYDWCTSASHHQSRLDNLLGSLEQLGDYNWPGIKTGIESLGKFTKEVDNFADEVLESVQNDLINHDPELTIEMAKLYLDWAKHTPKAKRLTSLNRVQLVIDAQQMARLIEEVLRVHADTLSRMIPRLDLMRKTETDENAKDMLTGYTGLTRQVLCRIQHLYHEVEPNEFLSGPYPESDMGSSEVKTLGQVESDVMRWYATYGVIMRHQDVLDTIIEDLEWLWERIRSHLRQ